MEMWEKPSSPRIRFHWFRGSIDVPSLLLKQTQSWNPLQNKHPPSTIPLVAEPSISPSPHFKTAESPHSSPPARSSTKEAKDKPTKKKKKKKRRKSWEMETEDYSAAEEVESSYISMDPLLTKSRSDKKRRFSEEQVKSLESMFESQAKLEPRKKLQLAKELGLQPRQVAIWFQNKRARWKSKQLESEYNALKANYDALLSSVESLKKEKQILIKQSQKLTELLKKPSEASSNDGDSNCSNGKRKEDARPCLLVYSGDEEKNPSFFNQEEAEYLYMGEPESGYLTSIEQPCDFNCSSSSEQCCTTPEWWESWPMTE